MSLLPEITILPQGKFIRQDFTMKIQSISLDILGIPSKLICHILFQSVLEKERKGDYLGKTVQVKYHGAYLCLNALYIHLRIS